ncbi:unnamed protein product [Phytophthora lilii]|uniref:Choline transporter-like protein n=1 Tax=Phytophthora lilii TaxID=2077276 RepID=A0A9W6UDQ4_9STRA|nr:unnamed protein product [Phytophthora lilii]
MALTEQVGSFGLNCVRYRRAQNKWLTVCPIGKLTLNDPTCATSTRTSRPIRKISVCASAAIAIASDSDAMYSPVLETDPMLTPSGGKPRRSPPSSAVNSLRLEPPPAQCHDAFFAVLFLGNVAILGVLAWWKGLPALKEDMGRNRSDGRVPQGHAVAWSLVALLCALGTALALLWMKLLMTYAASMIRVALWLNVALVLGFAVATFSVNAWAALAFLAMAAINVWYVYAVQDRIGFASANLKAACAALKQHAALFALAFVLVLQQLLWMGLWGLASLGMHQLFVDADPDCDREIDLASRGRSHGGLCVGLPAYAALFYMLVSVYWGQQVLQNILTCTTAGVVATWWYQPNAAKATVGALYRSVTTSFGSICFGSLIVAVLQALRTMADMAKRRANEENNGGLACLACMAECILSCLANVMEYVNQWAYVYVGVYGYPFRTSGKAVMDLFNNRGWTAVINDDLTSGALSFGAMGVGVATCCIGLLMVRFSPVEWFTALGSRMSVYGTMAMIGFMVGIIYDTRVVTVSQPANLLPDTTQASSLCILLPPSRPSTPMRSLLYALLVVSLITLWLSCHAATASTIIEQSDVNKMDELLETNGHDKTQHFLRSNSKDERPVSDGVGSLRTDSGDRSIGARVKSLMSMLPTRMSQGIGNLAKNTILPFMFRRVYKTGVTPQELQKPFGWCTSRCGITHESKDVGAVQGVFQFKSGRGESGSIRVLESTPS